jgi:hypothetical protein
MGVEMARWSDAMKLTDIHFHRPYLKGFPGVYELGYVRGGYFYPKYIGRARTEQTCLFTRLRSYIDPNRCHNKYLLAKLEAERHNVWFHVCRVADPAFSEASLLFQFGLGRDDGLYAWNQRYESGQLFTDDE